MNENRSPLLIVIRYNSNNLHSRYSRVTRSYSLWPDAMDVQNYTKPPFGNRLI